MLLNDKLNDNDDIMKQMRGLYARANSVLRKFAACSFEVKLRLLPAFCTQVSIVFIRGINLPNRLCPRSEWHIIMFSGFYLDIEEVAAPVKCLSQMIYIYNFEGRMRKHINDFTMRVGSSSNVLIATLRENSFIHAGPLRQKWMRSVYTVYNY